ncbi:Transformation/transcription domain-associated protein, partial [Stegodyphus mimosarum]
MPSVNIVEKYNTYAKQLCIKGDDGKVYTYLIMANNNHSDTEKSEKVLQLFQFLNLFLSKEHGTAKRSLKFFIPRTVTFKPYLRVVSDDESSLSLFDIYKQNCIEMSREFDAPVASYFEMVCSLPINPYIDTDKMLNIFQNVQENFVPVNILKEWTQNTYPGAADYFVFRKQFVLYYSLAAFAEYAFHLTLQSPDMMYIHKDTGVISNISFKFESLEGNVHTVRRVPFRLTPNIYQFVTPLGIRGVVTAVLLATANCFKKHRKSIQELLQVILKYEVINNEKHLHYMESEVNGEERINDIVTRVVCEALQRIEGLSKCESVRPKACKLVKSAKDYDNLCLMDPLWYPWL